MEPATVREQSKKFLPEPNPRWRKQHSSVERGVVQRLISEPGARRRDQPANNAGEPRPSKTLARERRFKVPMRVRDSSSKSARQESTAARKSAGELTAPVHRPLHRRLSHLLLVAAASLLNLTIVVAQEFRLNEVQRGPDRTVLRHPARPDRYYRLLRGERPVEVSYTVELRLGGAGETTPASARCGMPRRRPRPPSTASRRLRSPRRRIPTTTVRTTCSSCATRAP